MDASACNRRKSRLETPSVRSSTTVARRPSSTETTIRSRRAPGRAIMQPRLTPKNRRWTTPLSLRQEAKIVNTSSFAPHVKIQTRTHKLKRFSWYYTHEGVTQAGADIAVGSSFTASVGRPQQCALACQDCRVRATETLTSNQKHRSGKRCYHRPRASFPASVHRWNQ